jgi:hypothetical protein
MSQNGGQSDDATTREGVGHQERMGVIESKRISESAIHGQSPSGPPSIHSDGRKAHLPVAAFDPGVGVDLPN